MEPPEAKRQPLPGTEAVLAFLSPVVGLVRSIGEHLILLAQTVAWTVRPPFRARLFVEAGEYIGFGSLPIIALVGFFTGGVTALQSVAAFRTLGAEAYAASVVGLMLALELAPVLCGLMLAGRVGAGIATELGTMRITEQIDALETMAVSPIQYLVVPRVVMGTILGPLMTLLFFMIGSVGSYVTAVIVMGVDHGIYIEKFTFYVDPVHIVQGLIKGSVFGLAIALIGCYQGYTASGGGRGVGLATTRAVVIGSVAILLLDYFLTDILLIVMPISGTK